MRVSHSPPRGLGGFGQRTCPLRASALHPTAHIGVHIWTHVYTCSYMRADMCTRVYVYTDAQCTCMRTHRDKCTDVHTRCSGIQGDTGVQTLPPRAPPHLVAPTPEACLPVLRTQTDSWTQTPTLGRYPHSSPGSSMASRLGSAPQQVPPLIRSKARGGAAPVPSPPLPGREEAQP